MCGQNGYYQCGITSTTNNITSWKKIPLTNIKDVDSPSDSATVFLLKNGDVYVCGYTIYGQIG